MMSIYSGKTVISFMVAMILLEAHAIKINIGNEDCLFLHQRRSVNCSGLGIETIQEFPNAIAQANRLDLSSNSLTSFVKTVFDIFTHLIVLDLSTNQLQTLDRTIFASLKNLQVLDLSTNQLETLDGSVFASLTKLHVLKLSNNKLEVLDGNIFIYLTELKILLLSANLLETLDRHIFDSLTKLQVLAMSKNEMRMLVLGTFDALVNLDYMLLFKNYLTELVPGTFDSTINLKDLDLTNNSLTTLVPGTIDSLTQVEQLSLAGNPLTTLDYQMFDIMTNLKILYLPAICNCTENMLFMIPFLDKISYTPAIIVNRKNLTVEWRELTGNCSSTWIDHPYCDSFRKATWSEWESVVDCSESCGKGKQLLTRTRYAHCIAADIFEVKTLECYGNNCIGSSLNWDNWYENMKSNTHLKFQMKGESDAIKKELEIDKKTTNAALRRRVSIRDQRMSSAVMGFLAALIVLIPFIFAICSDLCPCADVDYTGRRGLKRKRKTIPDQF